MRAWVDIILDVIQLLYSFFITWLDSRDRRPQAEQKSTDHHSAPSYPQAPKSYPPHAREHTEMPVQPYPVSEITDHHSHDNEKRDTFKVRQR